MYTYVEGAVGITNCIPLWGSDRTLYYGAYCLDQIPSGEDKSFVKQFYNFEEEDLVSYMIFNDEKDYGPEFIEMA